MSAILERMFIEILNMSLTACIVIAAVLIVRLFLKKLPRIFSYALWAVVLFRLLCPVSFSAPLSLLGVLQSESAVQGRMEYIPQDIGYQTKPQVTLPLSVLNETVNHSLPAGNPAASVNPLQIWLYIGSRLWALGILISLLYSAFCSLKLHKRLRKARHLRDNLYRLPGGGTPFVCGLIHPHIYVPDSVDIGRSDYIVLHEQTHICRGDHILRLLAYLALCLHWFNPLVWLAFFLSARDMEMSCDEAVLRKIGSGVKKDYSASLLALAAANPDIRGVPLAFGEKEPQSRIKNVLRYKKPAAVLLAVAVLICVPAAFFLLGNPGAKEQKTETVEPYIETEKEQTAETIEPYTETDFDGPDEQEEEDTEESILQLTPKIVQSGEVPDGTYLIYPRSLSRSLRGFDRFAVDIMSDDEIAASPLSGLLFADDCVFMVNREVDKIRYEEVNFDEFAELTDAAFSWINPTVRCVFRGGLITEAALLSAHYGTGITYEPMAEDDWYEFIGGLEELSSAEMLGKYYTLVRTEDEDLDSPVGRIEIYTGNIGDGDSGIVLFYDKQGKLLDTASAHHARAGWNNIYLGHVDDADYVMTVHIENRDDYGAYSYQVYWFDEKGNPMQIAGSSFTFGADVGYDDHLFANWAGQLQHYLAHSHLLLSSQEGELRTEPVLSEADKYNYETLKP